MDKAVFGIIGVGGIAQSQHLPNVARAPHAFLKTACDVRADVLRAMQEKYRISDTYCRGWGRNCPPGVRVIHMVDKGWLAALDHFAECVLTGATPRNATARDGLEASRLAHAAIRSRETGEIVRL